jgi:hypothetical protein
VYAGVPGLEEVAALMALLAAARAALPPPRLFLIHSFNKLSIFRRTPILIRDREKLLKVKGNLCLDTGTRLQVRR